MKREADCGVFLPELKGDGDNARLEGSKTLYDLRPFDGGTDDETSSSLGGRVDTFQRGLPSATAKALMLEGAGEIADRSCRCVAKVMGVKT